MEEQEYERLFHSTARLVSLSWLIKEQLGVNVPKELLSELNRILDEIESCISKSK